MADALGYLIQGWGRGTGRFALRRIRREARAENRIGRSCILFLAIAATFFTGAIVRAQTPAPVQAVRFTVFAAKPISDVAFAPRPNAAAQTLQFHPTARSPRYEYRGTMPLRFVDATSGAIMAEANIPAGIRDALLLFTPIEATAGGPTALRFQVAVLDDGAARHSAGGLAVLNLSGLALSGTINTGKVTLKPGLNPTIMLDRSAKIVLHTTFKERNYQSFSSSITLGRNERALLILFPPFYKGSLEVQSRLLIDQPPANPVR